MGALFWLSDEQWAAVEPHLSDDAGRRFPHKLEWMNKYLGILIFRLRPL